MKILVNGNLDLLKKIKKFRCKSCGCIFEANQSEYQFVCDQREPFLEAVCACPCCKRKVYTNN